MPLPPALTNFNIQQAGVNVWLFKKSGGQRGQAPNYNGRWIRTTPDLTHALKGSTSAQIGRVEEVLPFNLLAQNNESSALTIDSLETHAPVILQKTATPLQRHAVTASTQIANTAFYVIRLVHNNVPLLAVRKTDTSWRTKKRRMRIDVVFRDEGLALDDEPTFSLHEMIDFFVFADQIYVLNKRNFESIMNYRAAHESDFENLKQEPAFNGLFTDLTVINEYVGANRIQLRRASAIRQKAHYLDEEFMERLRANFAGVGLNLQFDNEGRIDPTPESCPDIFQALLDHRLTSAFSTTNYDVQDATPVG